MFQPKLRLTLLSLIGLSPMLLPLIYITASVLIERPPAVGGNFCELVAVCCIVVRKRLAVLRLSPDRNASAGCDDVLCVCTYCRMAEHLDTATNPHTLNNAARVGWMRPVIVSVPGNNGLDALMWRILFRAHLSILS